jgi:PAS domain S-box-containing protein
VPYCGGFAYPTASTCHDSDTLVNLPPKRQKVAARAVRYGLAVAATAAAVVIGKALQPITYPSVSPPFILAVAAASLYGGIGPGVAASLLGAMAISFWFLPPLHTFAVAGLGDAARLLVFLVAATVITWLGGTVRKQRWSTIRTNQSLRASEERFRLATEALSGFLFDWDLVADRVEWFGCSEEVVGFRADDHPQDGGWWRSRIHPEDLAAAIQARDEAIQSQAPSWMIEYRVQHRDGHYVDVAVRGNLVRDSTGRVVRAVGKISDVTDRRRWEREREAAGKALRASEERFRLASEALAGFLYDWDPVTNRLELFGGTEEVLGFPLQEVSAEVAWFESRVHPDDLPRCWAAVHAAFDSGAPGYLNIYRVLHRNGYYVHVADRSRILRDESGRAIRVLGGVSDISERLRLESDRAELLQRERGARAAAEAAARARDEMLGVVSHDLRNPLAAIGLCASALSQSIDSSAETVQRMLASIKHSADSTDRLIEDLLDVSSIEAGHLALAPRAESPRDLLAQATDLFVAVAGERGVVLETQAAPDLPAVRADAERVVQGLANLLTNSLKFTAPGGHITLRAQADPSGVRFAVEDTGVGIAAEDLPHVFERFWQKHQGGSERGTGLGLAIVRGIVDAHGGQVDVESTPGKGSRFSFTLPVSKSTS